MDASTVKKMSKQDERVRSYHPVILKLELLSQGLRISPAAAEELGKRLKVDHIELM